MIEARLPSQSPAARRTDGGSGTPSYGSGVLPWPDESPFLTVDLVFAATFLGIISILVVNTVGHHAIDYSLSYRRVGLPCGLVVLAVAYVFLATLWTKRLLR